MDPGPAAVVEVRDADSSKSTEDEPKGSSSSYGASDNGSEPNPIDNNDPDSGEGEEENPKTKTANFWEKDERRGGARTHGPRPGSPGECPLPLSRNELHRGWILFQVRISIDSVIRYSQHRRRERHLRLFSHISRSGKGSTCLVYIGSPFLENELHCD